MSIVESSSNSFAVTCLSFIVKTVIFCQNNNGRDLKKRLSSHIPIANCCYSTGYYSKHINTNRESFLIKCLQILPNFAYIWGISLRLLDLACPIEVGRPYLHLFADH